MLRDALTLGVRARPNQQPRLMQGGRDRHLRVAGMRVRWALADPDTFNLIGSPAG